MLKKKMIIFSLMICILLIMVPSVGDMRAAASDGFGYTSNNLGFSMTLPSSWAGKYRVDETQDSVWFASISNADAGAGGLLFGIEVYNGEPDIPTRYVELLRTDGKCFCAVYPGGIESAYEDPMLVKEYNEMYDDIETILKTFRYTAKLPFTDISTSAWYYSDVKIAYDGKLINGTSATKFAPDDNLTYAEAVKLAACMHQLYTTGTVTLTNGSSAWYQSYVDYAKANRIISKDYSWGARATRAGYMEIFADALPDTAFVAINTVADGTIPDVSATHANAASIYKLYRAGIVLGVDETHSCNPSANIKRSEVAAILTRMMDSGQRINFSF